MYTRTATKKKRAWAKKKSIEFRLTQQNITATASNTTHELQVQPKQKLGCQKILKKKVQ